MEKETFTEFFKSKLFAGIVAGICIMLVVICIFEIGVIVGYHEASFSSHWGENYGRNFAGDTDANGFGLPDIHAPSPDGIYGKIVSVSASSSSSATAFGTTTIVISGNQKPEVKIIINGDTVIRDQENTVGVSSLIVGSYAVVLGTPSDDGDILASLIRILPQPDSAMGSGAQAGNPNSTQASSS